MVNDCNNLKTKMPQPLIQAHAISKSVKGPAGTFTILDAVTLTVEAGEAIAVLGASGSGKTTLLGLLAGLDLPTAGQVSLLGQTLADLDEDDRAALRAGQVGFVFQEFQLLETATAFENVLLPLELAGRDNPRGLARQSLERVGLGSRQDHFPHQLSGGEQQRVAIARAFAPRPRVLFADEPTGNLDQVTGGRIIDLLFELRAETGTTLVLVTHDQELAKRCDHRLHLQAGRLEDPL